MSYDFLIIGSGLYGSIFAHEMTNRGKKCLIIEKRPHIGGNCYTENVDNIHIHKYGPHIFHTNSDVVWNYVNKFVKFNDFINRPKVYFKNKIYSFPINLLTMQQLWGLTDEKLCREKLESTKILIKNPSNLEEWCLSNIGKDLYYVFICGYTKKQWGCEPRNLPSFIIKRLPFRFDYNDNYYFDKYQGIPIGGYTQIFEKLLKNVEYKLNVDYFENKNYWDSIANNIIYTGPIDKYFNYKYGKLDYRSLKFETKNIEIENYQSNALINYTDYYIPYTRICEHKHFDDNNSKNTIITKEYSEKYNGRNEPFYPINDDKNNNVFKLYKSESECLKNIFFAGRLGDYKYYDMHHVIANALRDVEKFLC
jgi:UDP-galactopyranose mutase